MTFRVRFMRNAATPLSRVRVRYNRSLTSTAMVNAYTDEDGFVTINRNNRARRGIGVEVFAQNPVVTAVTGPMNAPVFFRTRMREDDVLGTPANAQVFFDFAEQARQVYEKNFRPFTPFGDEAPHGNPDPTARRRIRMVFPDSVPGNASFCDPHAPQSQFPMVHLDRADSVNAAGTPITATVAAELAHAVHFGTLPAARRRELRGRYLVSLIGEAINDIADGAPVGRWDANDEVSPLMAFVEAFDLFSTTFNQSAGANHAAHVADFFANQAPNLLSGVIASGRDVPGAVFGVIFVDYAQSPGITLDAAVEQYINSRALTFGAFRRRVRRRFGATSNEAIQLDAAATGRGLL